MNARLQFTVILSTFVMILATDCAEINNNQKGENTVF